MMKYKCDYCGAVFDESEFVKAYYYEEAWGRPIRIEVDCCPNCHTDSFDCIED